MVGYGTDAPPSNAAEGRRDFLSAHPHLRGQRLLLYQGSLQPAQGSERLLQAVAHVVRLDSVRIGDVTVYGVEALVTPQSMSYVLLGNSFLNRFQMQRQNDQLTLEKRF